MPSATEAKRGHRLDAKDTASAAQKSDGALKAHKENVPRLENCKLATITATIAYFTDAGFRFVHFLSSRKNVGPKVHTG